MGGYGSGRRASWNKRTTVEACRQLDAGRWMHEGIVRAGACQWGSWVWRNASTGEQLAAIGYGVQTQERAGWVRLSYTITPHTGERRDYAYTVPLVTTRLHSGGFRWWFLCPLSRNEQPCLRRVGKLYLPPSGRYYGCRQCYNLTYTSSQESDKRVSWLVHDPVALSKFIHRAIHPAGHDTLKGAPHVMLALNASPIRRARLRAEMEKY